MTHCRGCGSLLDLTSEEVSPAVDDLLESTRPASARPPQICPLCGHAAEQRSRRWSLLFAILLAVLVVVSGVAITYYARLDTERQQAVDAALQGLRSNEDATRILGAPIAVHGDPRA